ncbi:MAG: hypothetical protein JNJ54_27855 [Myxococcaceae bacterium]|nr:hypothetical protein [Myxococcaceae bacterium]
MKRFTLAALTLSAFVAFADDDLKPAQEEAKEAFENELEAPMKALNEKCGTRLVAPAVDWKNYSKDAIGNISWSSYCTSALIDPLTALCDRPAYKKAIAKKVTSLKCNLAGGQPPAKGQGYNEHTQAHIKLEKGVFSYTLHKDHSNLTDNGKAVLEKAFN